MASRLARIAVGFFSLMKVVSFQSNRHNVSRVAS